MSTATVTALALWPLYGGLWTYVQVSLIIGIVYTLYANVVLETPKVAAVGGANRPFIDRLATYRSLICFRSLLAEAYDKVVKVLQSLSELYSLRLGSRSIYVKALHAKFPTSSSALSWCFQRHSSNGCSVSLQSSYILLKHSMTWSK